MNISLCKFTVNFKKELAAYLKSPGMRRAFEPRADFRGIATDEHSLLYLGRVIHSAVITLTERGTEAAAATAVGGIGGVPPLLAFNRPFLFFIKDNRTGAILFMGAVNNPVPGAQIQKGDCTELSTQRGGEPPPQVRLQSVEIRGALDESKLRNALKARSYSFQSLYHYNYAKKERFEPGEMTLKLEISGTGDIQKVTILKSTLTVPISETRIQHRFQSSGFSFPKPEDGKPAEVIARFTFGTVLVKE